MSEHHAAPLRLLQLHDDCLRQVLARLPPKSLERAAAACKDLRRVAVERLAELGELRRAAFLDEVGDEALRRGGDIEVHAHELSAKDERLLVLALTVLPISFLCLNGNGLGDAGVWDIFGQCPPGCLTSLNALNASGNQIGPGGVAVLGKALVPMKLTKLHLDGNNLCDAGVRILFFGFGGCFPSLETLDLAMNKIGQAGVSALATSAKANYLPKLGSLDLSGNPGLGGDGAAALASAIGQCAFSGLRRCYLNSCGMDEEGAAALMRAICTPGALPRLITLSLQSNQMGDDALAALADAIEDNIDKLWRYKWDENKFYGITLPGLQELTLTDNALSETGVAALIDVLREHPVDALPELAMLNLSDNDGLASISHLSDEILQSLHQLTHDRVEFCETILQIIVGDEYIEPADFEADSGSEDL